jgi:MotA/TolQ/ExbB proton channel family
LFRFIRLIPTFLYFSPFYTWFLTFCLSITGLFWAHYNGFLAAMIAADITGICLVITILTPFVMTYIGWIAYKIQFDKIDNWKSSYLATELAIPHEFKAITILTGVFGTAVGLLYTLSVLSSLMTGMAGGADLFPVISKVAGGLAVALWVTVVSLAAALIVWIQTFIVEVSFEKVKLILARGWL